MSEVNATENKQEQPVYTYATLLETNDEECETWYTFIRLQGNEEAIAHLQKQIDSIDWYMMDGLSTFTIETEYLVSEQTAKEMTKIDVNHYMFHKKFDGKLKTINLKLKSSYSDAKKMRKVFDILGYGQIEDFVDGEDIDPEDLVSGSEESDPSEEESEGSEESDESEEESEREKVKTKVPKVLQPIPRVAMAKRFNSSKNKQKK